jgi:hypothetical protein
MFTESCQAIRRRGKTENPEITNEAARLTIKWTTQL